MEWSQLIYLFHALMSFPGRRKDLLKKASENPKTRSKDYLDVVKSLKSNESNKKYRLKVDLIGRELDRKLLEHNYPAPPKETNNYVYIVNFICLGLYPQAVFSNQEKAEAFIKKQELSFSDFLKRPDADQSSHWFNEFIKPLNVTFIEDEGCLHIQKSIHKDIRWEIKKIRSYL